MNQEKIVKNKLILTLRHPNNPAGLHCLTWAIIQQKEQLKKTKNLFLLL